MKRDRIVQFASSYLRAEDFNDCCVNGLQVAGAKDVERVVSGVSISLRLIRLAGVMRERLALLLRHDINVVGYHCHWMPIRK